MYSAGILPYTIIDSEIYILIGRERYDKSYSDFGGKHDRTDGSITETAYREFVEESMYTRLGLREFIRMNVVYTESRTLKGNIYYMFLVYMNTSTIIDIFETFYLNLNEMNEPRMFSSKNNVHEKDQMKLIRLTDILEMIDGDGGDELKLRPVFVNTMNMHRNFFKTFHMVAKNMHDINKDTTNRFIHDIIENCHGKINNKAFEEYGWTIARRRKRNY